MRKQFEILFEDEEIIVVVKPSGVLSQGDRKNTSDMVSLLKSYLAIENRKKGKSLKEEPYLAVIHRLDRQVRGIMVFAKTKKAAGILSEGMKGDAFLKKYVCVVGISDGKPLKEDGEYHRLESFLIYDKVLNRTLLEEKGDRAILKYRIVKVVKDRALVEVILLTGRHHQIRVQMTEISDGIQGDRKYYKKIQNESLERGNPALECVELSFLHPLSKEKLTFRCDTKDEIFREFL